VFSDVIQHRGVSPIGLNHPLPGVQDHGHSDQDGVLACEPSRMSRVGFAALIPNMGNFSLRRGIVSKLGASNNRPDVLVCGRPNEECVDS